MAEDYKKIAESIRSGKYLSDARGWFEAMYIGPIAERSFFLIIAVMAGLVCLFAFASILRLMPITVRDPIFVYAGERPDEVLKSLVPLAPHHAEQNPAIATFFLSEYVTMRESFDSRTFLNNAKFVRAQSDPNAYNAYVAAYNPTNPQSPFAPLGDLGQRIVTVESIVADKGKKIDSNEGSATVNFSTETRNVSNPDTQKWTARIDYIYTRLETKVDKDPLTKKPTLDVTDPHFQVTNYVLTQPSQNAH